MRDLYGSRIASTSVARSAAILGLLRRGNSRMRVGQISHRVSWKVGFVFVNNETCMMTEKRVVKSGTVVEVCHGCLQGGLTVPSVGGYWNWRLGDCGGWNWKANCSQLRSCHWSRSKCYCLTFPLTLLTLVITYQPSLQVCRHRMTYQQISFCTIHYPCSHFVYITFNAHLLHKLFIC